MILTKSANGYLENGECKMETKQFLLTDSEIHIQDVVAKVEDRNAGAINCFIGTVRELISSNWSLIM